MPPDPPDEDPDFETRGRPRKTVSAGVWLRRIEDHPKPPLHRCKPPMVDLGDCQVADGERRDIWRCMCGRRWIVGGQRGWPGDVWHRRYLPWPRQPEGWKEVGISFEKQPVTRVNGDK